MTKKGLGRGLDALFQSDYETVRTGEAVRQETLKQLKIIDIDPNSDQPRKIFDEAKIMELVQSIKQHGVVQPIIVSANGARYTLVAGERRWRAARLAGLIDIPAIIKDLGHAQALEIALIENLQREDLNSIEEAEGIKMLIDEHGLTQEQVAEKIGRSRPAITNALRLLLLPAELRKLVAAGTLSSGHARAMMTIENEDTKIDIARRAVEGGWSVRQVEEMAKRLKETLPEKKAPLRKTVYIADVEAILEEQLGTKVEVVWGKKKGTIRIEYYNDDDLERIVERLKT